MGMSAEELRAAIEEKTKLLLDPTTPPAEIPNINIELEKLYSSLESTEEWQSEQALEKEARRLKNEPLNKAALAELKVKYSEENQENNKALKERFETIPALRLILIDPADIVKKHQNDWKLMTTNLLSLEEMRAIAGNLPKFGRNQLRQQAWADALDNRIEKMASGADMTLDRPIKGVAKSIPRTRRAGNDGKSLFSAIKARGELPAIEEGSADDAAPVPRGGGTVRIQRPRKPTKKISIADDNNNNNDNNNHQDNNE